MARLVFEGSKNRNMVPAIYKNNDAIALILEYVPLENEEYQIKDRLRSTDGAEVLTSSGKMYKSTNREITSKYTGHSMNELRKLFKEKICSEYSSVIKEFDPENTTNGIPHIIDIFGYDNKSIEYFKEICPEKFSDIEIPHSDNTSKVSKIINSIINYGDNTRHKENLSSLKTYLNL